MTDRPGLVADIVTVFALLIGAFLFATLIHLAPRSLAMSMDALEVQLRLSGMNAIERFENGTPYRWSNGHGIVRLPNAGGASQVQLTLAGGPGRSVPVSISAGTSFTTTIVIAPDPRVYRLLVPASQGERVTIAIESPAIREGQRDIGVVVAGAAISGAGLVGGILPPLALASIGLYALFRSAWKQRVIATLVAGALLATVLAWHEWGGWQYATLTPLLALVGAGGLATALLSRWLPAHIDAPLPVLVLQRADLLAVFGLLVVALCVRLPWIAAADPVGDLELSARRMGQLFESGLAGAFRGDGDYMPLRLYWLWALSQLVPPLGGNFAAPLPAATLILIKLPSLLADLATIALIYLTARRWRTVRVALLLAGFYALTPAVWMNVAWWGQIDAALMLPIIAAVLLLERRGGAWSWVLWAVAQMIKPQAIVFAPLLYAATMRQHGARGVARGGLLAAGVVVGSCAPLVLAGQQSGLMQSMLGAVGRFPKLTNNAYNVWYLVVNGFGSDGFDTGQGFGPLSFRMIGVLLLGMVVALICAVLLFRSASLPTRAVAATALALAFFSLPTQIHERYLFLTLAFCMLAAVADLRLLLAYVVLAISAMLNIFGTLIGFWPAAYAAINATPLPMILAATNLLILVALCAHLVFGRLVRSVE